MAGCILIARDRTVSISYAHSALLSPTSYSPRSAPQYTVKLTDAKLTFTMRSTLLKSPLGANSANGASAVHAPRAAMRACGRVFEDFSRKRSRSAAIRCAWHVSQGNSGSTISAIYKALWGIGAPAKATRYYY